MNWVGDFVQKEVKSWHSVLSLGCGIMQGLGNWIETYPNTILSCGELWGVDIHKPSLDYLDNLKLGIHTVQADLNETPISYFTPERFNNYFNAVLMLDILEHLKNLEKANNLIHEALRLTKPKGKVIVLTPSKFVKNTQAIVSYGLPRNKFQLHKFLVPRKFLEGFGFKLRHVKTLDLPYFYGVLKKK